MGMSKIVTNYIKKNNPKGSIFGFIILSFILSRFIMMIIYASLNGDWNICNAVDKYNTWDAGWYKNYSMDLLDVGLDHPEIFAFFPLYPLVCAIGIKIFPFASPILIGSIISSILFMAGEYIVCNYISLTRGGYGRKQFIYIALMSFGPFSFYFSIMYTESLFVFLLALSFLYMYKGEYIKMGFSAAFLSATRNTGVLFVFVLLVFWIRKYRAEINHGIRDFFKTTFLNGRLVLGATMIPLGLFSYILFLKIYLGDGLAFIHVQKNWDKSFVGLFQMIKRLVVDEFPPNYLGLIIIGSLIVLTIIVFEYKRYEEAAIPLTTLVISASTSPFSIARYMLGSFGIMLGITDIIDSMSKVKRIVFMTVLFGLELILIKAWLGHNNLLT